MEKDRLLEETSDSCSDWESLELGLSLINNLFNFEDGEEQSSKRPLSSKSKPYPAYFKTLILDLCYSI
jgi:hypothetical protein